MWESGVQMLVVAWCEHPFVIFFFLFLDGYFGNRGELM